MDKKPFKLTQHQKRIATVELLYQYFLLVDNEAQEAYLKSLTQDKSQEPAVICTDILWYQSSLITEIEKHLKNGWKFKSLKPTEKAILLLGTYEIIHTTTQKAIIINEAIILAKQYCDKNTYKYINGVLDKINK